MKNTTVSLDNYQKILKEVQDSIALAQSEIVQTVTRKKVEMAWQIGKIINKSLPKENKEQYGKKLIEKLEKDTSISKTVLYKMRSFYKTYPKIPKDDPRLNWSHYRVLSGIKKIAERKYLEDLTRENSWDSSDLQKEVVKAKALQNKASALVKKNTTKKITSTRGKLFTYKIAKISGSKKLFFDCGFGVFREVKEALPRDSKTPDSLVLVSKSGEKYLVKKSKTLPQKIHTYVAYLEKLVDGDTIRVNLDLGFGIFHHEILRLAKINAPEIATQAGKKSAAEIAKILKDVPFLIVKSIKTDIYGRYVADVFLPQLRQNPKSKLVIKPDLQEVADKGIYLNQMLLDKNVAEIF